MKEENTNTIVCCSTCYNKKCEYFTITLDSDSDELRQYKRKCLSNSDLMLYWSKKTGHLQKLVQRYAYNFWQGKKLLGEFIKKEEMLLL